MSFPIAAAAVVHADDANAEDVLAAFSRELADHGVPIAGVVQRNSPNPGGKRHMDLIDVQSGESFRISQDLGKGAASCTLNLAGLAAASSVLRKGLEQQPRLMFINRFGEQERNGKGFADELGQIAGAGVPVIMLAAERFRQDWLDFTGGAGAVLPPEPDALRRWFAGADSVRQCGLPVLDATVAVVKRLLGPALDTITVERVVVGQFFTGVKLNTGSAGAAFTPPKPVIRSTDLGALPPAILRAGRLKGRPARAFLDDIREDAGIARALGVAVLNALADTCWRRFPHRGWRVDTGVDALTAAAVKANDKVVMVGAFVGYIRRLMQAGQPLEVLELNPAPLTEAERVHYRPAELAPQVLPGANVVLMTGSTVTNDTIDDLFTHIPPDARVVVIGPSVPLLPDVLGARGADVLASIRITDADHFLDVLAEGGGTQGTYDGAAELVVMRRRQ